MKPWPRTALPAAAILLALWSLLPLGTLWDGLELEYFSQSWQTWGWGTMVAGLVAALLLAPGEGRVARVLPSLWRRVMDIPSPVFVALVAAALAALTVAFTLIVFAGNPRNVDGFAQLFQARIFHAGRLWLTPPAELANFATLQMILGPGRWYAQYPPGQAAVLAVGLLAGAWWLLHPLVVAGFAVAVYSVARWCADESTARLTSLLLCLSPFVVAVAGSEMSHLPAATLGMGAAAFAVRAASGGGIASAAASGLLLGIMTAFRPLDAVAAALPVAVILWWSPRRLAALAAVAAAGALGTLPTLWYNGRTTGSWIEFGYTTLWGPQHSLGFHPVPFGVPLTLPRAIARTGMDLHQLNMYLLDSPVPMLVVVALGYFAGRRLLAARDAVPFAAAGALLGLLFFYWHRDTFYGPRFLYSVVGWLVLLLARAMVLLRRSAPAPDVTPGRDLGLNATFAVVIAIVTGLVAIAPGRISAYRHSTPDFNLHPARDAQRAGVGNAVVVIPDGWGSRLIARMWQLGLPVRGTSRLYAAIDACTLERTLAAAETTATAASRLPAVLDSIAGMRRPGVPGRVTADPNLRLQPNEVLAPECVSEIEVDQRGFYQFAPYLWLNRAGLDGDVVWARDLGPRNAALFRRYAGRAFFRYVPGQHREPLLLPLSGPGW